MIYLTYENNEGHQIALRVRDTLSSYGITVFVPPLLSRDIQSQDFSELGRWLSDCETLIAVVTLEDRPPALKWEIEAMERRRIAPVIRVDEYYSPEEELGPHHPDYPIAILVVAHLFLAKIQRERK